MASGSPGFDWRKSKPLRDAAVITAVALLLWILWVQLLPSQDLNEGGDSRGISFYLEWLPLVLILMSGATVFFLRRWLVQKRRFHDYVKAEELLYRRDAILNSVSYAAEQFLEAGSWEENIHEVLKQLGRASAVSRVYIFKQHRDEEGRLLPARERTPGIPGLGDQYGLNCSYLKSYP